MSALSVVRFVIKPIVFAAALTPVALLAAAALDVYGTLGANPIDKITDVTGIWALRFVLLTLAVTPLRRLTGWNALVRFRRPFGLFAFFYAALHFSTWLVLDQFFAWEFILKDIAKRPYITVGFIGFVLMIPLALTSTAGWIRRLGGRRWNLLHRLVYLTGIAGVIHYWWLVKVVTSSQIAYMAILVTLLGIRVWFAFARPRVAVRATPHPNPLPASGERGN
jgi:sulfoxide reductase heme-binding subunit YedZ